MMYLADRPSDDITGKSPAGSTGRLKRERPAETDRRGSSPAYFSSPVLSAKASRSPLASAGLQALYSHL